MIEVTCLVDVPLDMLTCAVSIPSFLWAVIVIFDNRPECDLDSYIYCM